MSTEPSETVELAHIGAEAENVGSVYVHGTGFCKEVWFPVVRRVDMAMDAEDTSAMLLDQRGHGDSTPFTGPLLWDLVAKDVAGALDDVPHPIVGVGHSGGGAAIARTEILSPGTFSMMILIEPIVLPPPFERRDLRLAVNAENRRRTFPSREAARHWFSTGSFSAWDDEVLDLYVDHAFHEADGGWALKCEPSAEAETYRQGTNVDTWDRLNQIRCPVVILSGENSDSHQDPYRSILVDRFRDATSHVIADVGHLAPMEAPALIGDMIADLIIGEARDEDGGQASGTIV